MVGTWQLLLFALVVALVAADFDIYHCNYQRFPSSTPFLTDFFSHEQCKISCNGTTDVCEVDLTGPKSVPLSERLHCCEGYPCYTGTKACLSNCKGALHSCSGSKGNKTCCDSTLLTALLVAGIVGFLGVCGCVICCCCCCACCPGYKSRQEK